MTGPAECAERLNNGNKSTIVRTTKCNRVSATHASPRAMQHSEHPSGQHVTHAPLGHASFGSRNCCMLVITMVRKLSHAKIRWSLKMNACSRSMIWTPSHAQIRWCVKTCMFKLEALDLVCCSDLNVGKLAHAQDWRSAICALLNFESLAAAHCSNLRVWNLCTVQIWTLKKRASEHTNKQTNKLQTSTQTSKQHHQQTLICYNRSNCKMKNGRRRKTVPLYNRLGHPQWNDAPSGCTCTCLCL